jgi:hypothetical protein
MENDFKGRRGSEGKGEKRREKELDFSWRR